MAEPFHLRDYGLGVANVLRNLSVPRLYEEGIIEGDLITSTGALAAYSGAKTGRSPKDKRIVDHGDSSKNVWWGSINIKQADQAFMSNRQRAIDFLNTCKRLYVVDGYAGWDPRRQLKIRVICARPYHALFMHNMLIRPTAQQLASFDRPDYTIINAGQFPAPPIRLATPRARMSH
jgi:phosphoenolpyruvate carboxykinase (ATP)